MNHIGAKTEAAPSAWDQLAQTQNYEHPVRQTTQIINAPKPPINNQTPLTPTQPPIQQQQSPLPQIQSPPQQTTTDQTKLPEYGEELHPELVCAIRFLFSCLIRVIIIIIHRCVKDGRNFGQNEKIGRTIGIR